MRISTPNNTLSHYNVESMSYLLVHIYYYLVLYNIIEFDIYSTQAVRAKHLDDGA